MIAVPALAGFFFSLGYGAVALSEGRALRGITFIVVAVVSSWMMLVGVQKTHQKLYLLVWWSIPAGATIGFLTNKPLGMGGPAVDAALFAALTLAIVQERYVRLERHAGDAAAIARKAGVSVDGPTQGAVERRPTG